MPRLEHFYGQNHLHYLTVNAYRKARIFDSDRYKRKFVQTLDDLRTELGFRIIGYVMRNNPVKRGLVAQPGDWPWSSWRYYYLDDSSVLAMDRLP
jgi:hypothetical protein